MTHTERQAGPAGSGEPHAYEDLERKLTAIDLRLARATRAMRLARTALIGAALATALLAVTAAVATAQSNPPPTATLAPAGGDRYLLTLTNAHPAKAITEMQALQARAPRQGDRPDPTARHEAPGRHQGRSHDQQRTLMSSHPIVGARPACAPKEP